MALARIVEWFRPLVEAQQWDYVVLWKLGNDPSRFIEWMGCCCSGGCDNAVNEEKDDKLLCRDIHSKHSVRTKACESLAHFPASLDLYSGVHSEVVISRQYRWLNHHDDHDGFGTRVLIPVQGGLIELHSTKNIVNDRNVLDSVLGHCREISLEQEATSPSEVLSLDHALILSPIPSVVDGSPSISSTLTSPNRHMLLDSNIENCDHLSWPSERSSGSKCNKNGLVTVCEEEKSAKRVTKRKEKGDYQSKNLLAERERRKRIRSGLLTLRSLVPKITKMDMASILGDAVSYIRGLQMEEMELRNELNEIQERDGEEEECQKGHDGLVIQDLDNSKGLDNCFVTPEKSSVSLAISLKKQPELKVEVKHIGERNFFIKLFVAHKRGGFVRLLEIADSLNLHVVSTNSTTFNGSVQNILEVKADKDIEPKELRDFFIELTS